MSAENAPEPGTLYTARQTELVDLVVLGLLSERPRHTYDMHRALRERGTEYIRGLPRSLYHGVERNLAEGFIEEVATSREGARPERTVYQATEEGRAELISRLQDLLGRRTDAGTTYAILSLLGYLTPEQTLWSLRNRAAALDGEARNVEARMHGMGGRIPRLFLVEVEFICHQLRAERDWVRSIIEEIETGTLRWPTAEDMAAFAPPD